MKVGLFIPCFVDAVYPKAGIATLELLEHSGADAEYPLNQNLLRATYGQRRRSGGLGRCRGKLCKYF